MADKHFDETTAGIGYIYVILALLAIGCIFFLG
jgi:hypothetical protein